MTFHGVGMDTFCNHAIFALDTKWRIHPNLVVDCDLVGVLCTQARVKPAFFHKVDGQASGRAGNDITFSNYITFSLQVIRHVANI